jgi:transposase
MSLGRLVVTAVRIEGRTKAEVARDYGVSRQWVHELVKRFDAEGEAGLEPRPRHPRRNRHDVARHIGTMSRDITQCTQVDRSRKNVRR